MADNTSQVFRNFYTFENDIALTNGASGEHFGRSITRYEIRRRRDVKNLGSALGYVLMMKQRIIIPSTTGYQPGPISQTSYNNYPAILVNQLGLTANNGAEMVLQEMFPRTLNSQVSTSTSSGQGTSQSVTQQNTSGSSDTNVNTFGVGISVGMFGELPVVNLTAEYSHSWEDTRMQSQTHGIGTATDRRSEAGSTMSVKDWSSYGYLDDKAIAPIWVWGQGYPWDVIQFNQSTNGTEINLPDFVQSRLLNGNLVLPPSQLSLFGLDFTMIAGWIIDFPKGVAEDETVTISHITRAYTASHQLNGSKISATLQNEASANQSQYSSDAIDLSAFALDPIISASSKNGAAIGFTANPFSYPPGPGGSKFKIVSPANNLQVTGSGFSSGMTTDFDHPVKMTATFKIADTSIDYSLLFMHWIGKDSGSCELKYTVNGTWKGTMLVSSTEGDGGQNNVSSIELRNSNFTSINFHDYLKVGTNTVEIEVVPTDSSVKNSYTLFAMAVGQD